MRDEQYIIDICDRVLVRTAERQKRFDFLLGDPDKNGRCVRLPIDAYYADLKLAIEYWEGQHTQPTSFMDKRDTVSHMNRGEQRKLYDYRRVEMLPKNGIKLIVLDYTMFPHWNNCRLKRIPDQDEEAVRESLAGFL